LAANGISPAVTIEKAVEEFRFVLLAIVDLGLLFSRRVVTLKGHRAEYRAR
jgi:hypothetical protein